MTEPMRLACLDLGSNGIRYAIAESYGAGHLQLLRSERAAVRLGQGVFRSGRLDPQAKAEAVRVLREFRDALKAQGVTRYRAVATSAVRESSGGRSWVDSVNRTLKLNLEIISGSEEARLVALAVNRRMPLSRKRPWLLVNLGGGSVEISVVDERGVRENRSHNLGAVRLLAELDGRAAPGVLKDRLEAYLEVLHLPALPDGPSWAGLIGTGGNIEALARLARGRVRASGVVMLTLPRLRSLIRTLTGMTPAQRMKKLKLKPDRADVILPAALVYERCCRLAGVNRIWVPNVGTKEGLLLDLASRRPSPGKAPEPAQPWWSAAVVLGRHYRFDERHARHVTKLALQFFDQLGTVHGLEPKDRPLLAAAAVLHDIGMFVSFKRHHKHSAYLIAQSELPGLSPEDMRVVSAVARYHRKAFPDAAHPEFAPLSRGQRLRVKRLASLLRMADALDRGHRQDVAAVSAQAGSRTLELVLHARTLSPIERWALARKADLFRAVFRRQLKVRVDRTPQKPGFEKRKSSVGSRRRNKPEMERRA